MAKASSKAKAKTPETKIAEIAAAAFGPGIDREPEPAAPVEEAQPHAAGRPSSFRPEYTPIAQRLAARGAVDAEIAEIIGTSVRTLYRWKAENDEFCQALNAGKQHPDDRVKRSLYQRATGYDYVEEQAFKVKCGQYEERVEKVEVVRHQPADTTAQIFWLKNRDPLNWRDRIEHSGPHGGAIPVETRQIDPSMLPPEQRLLFATLLRQALAKPVEQIEGEFRADEDEC